MKLQKQHNDFDTQLYLNTPIPQTMLEQSSLRDFDKDGYEVPATLERAFYDAQGIKLNYDIQYHVAPVKPWYIDLEDSEQGLVLDHCMLLQRFALGGSAFSQVQETVQSRPILQKLLNIKPKWGIDFSLDYVSTDIVMEVIHIEQDFDNLENAQEAKEKLEYIIENTDWLAGAKKLIDNRNEWEKLSSDDHSDYKAQFFGWHRAFDNLKVFS